MKRKLSTSDDLIGCVCIFNSHEDFSVYEAIYAGYDDNLNLIIMCEHTDSDESDYDCATCAVLNKSEAKKLAKRFKVTLLNLPFEIADSMSEWDELVCPLPSDVRNCFKEITECLIDEGCHFRIKRKSAQNGYVTC